MIVSRIENNSIAIRVDIRSTHLKGTCTEGMFHLKFQRARCSIVCMIVMVVVVFMARRKR